MVASVISGFAGQLFLIATGVLTARILGVEDRGHLAFLTICSVAVAAIINIGIPHALTYYIAKKEIAAREILAYSRKAAITQCLAAPPITFFLMQPLSSGMTIIETTMLWAVMGTTGLITHNYGMAILQGVGAFKFCNIMRLIPVAIFALMLGTIWLSPHASIELVTASWSLGNICGGLATYWLAEKTFLTTSNKRLNNGTALNKANFLHFGFKGQLGTTSPIETLRLDQFLVSHFFDAQALGIYVVAQSFNNFPKLVSHSIGMILSPHAASLLNKKAALKTIWKATGYSIFINTLIALPLAAATNWLVPLFFGAAFNEATTIVPVMLIGAVGLAGRRVLCDGLRGIGNPSAATWSELSSYLMIIVLWHPMTAFAGLPGAAWCIAISNMLSLVTALIIGLFHNTEKE